MEFFIPSAFSEGISTLAGPEGAIWLRSLPERMAQLCTQWQLQVEGPPIFGYLACVLPVVQGSTRCVLKISWVDESTQFEAAALRVWQGHGAVRLLDEARNQGALLLERADGSRPLGGIPILEAFPIAVSLLRRLAVHQDSGFPSVGGVTQNNLREARAQWAHLGLPDSHGLWPWVNTVAGELSQTSDACSEPWLVDYDLHYGNVLRAQREPWLVIDPKVAIGDVEYGVAQLFWNRLDDMISVHPLDYWFAVAVEVGQLDPVKTLQWTLIRCVEYWAWALSAGLTEDPRRCAYLVDWILRQL